MDAALKAGKCVWKQGLLRKGLGLCHGICGNAYALNALYKCTGDIEWKRRSQMFLLWTGDQAVLDTIAANKNGGLKVQGVPDTPYSLMEGQA